MGPSNYPPGVTGNEPEIAGDPEEPTPAERVGATLREFRIREGFKPAELAETIGISRSHLANIEAGRRNLDPVLAARAAKALNVPAHTLRT